jgi:hypothetical protein
VSYCYRKERTGVTALASRAAQHVRNVVSTCLSRLRKARLPSSQPRGLESLVYCILIVYALAKYKA